MLIKPGDDRTADLEILEKLSKHPKASARTRQNIEQEMRQIRAGVRGEEEAAYEIEFHHRASQRWAVIHDLRIEYQGRVAQIDHLLINRVLDIWVCESKHFSEGIAINEHGEFNAFYQGRAYGVPSPIEQNRKHMAVLQALLDSSIVSLPTRLGMSIRSTLHSAVLVSKRSRITRPKAKVAGIESIVKNDQFREMIERRIDEESVTKSLLTSVKFISAETLEEFATQISKLHRPKRFDWAAKFGLADRSEAVESDRPVLPLIRTVVEHAAPSDVAPEPTMPTRVTSAAVADREVASAKIPTSKLASKLGVANTAAMLLRLVAAGYLAPAGERHALTPKGEAAGGVFIEKSRFGPYFVWPADLQIRKH
ncbi:hypothetical protein BH11PSE9_BH11PSE9_06680 [soil metagenome]